MKRRFSRYHGLLLVDKPAEHTSHDLVAIIRRLSGQRRVGHTGTLDPLATGLMGVLLGEATRLEPWLVKMDKLYTGRLRLGLSTDTNDLTGRVIAENTGPWPSEDEIKRRLKALEGQSEQVPPAFSAIKVGGRRAYQAARAGEQLELKARPVTARRLELLAYQPPEIEFLAEVSSGYYIRSLVRDLGEDLRLGAALTALRRERVGGWSVDRAYTLDQLRAWRPEDWTEQVLAPAEALPHWPSVTLQNDAERFFRHGRSVPAPGLGQVGPYKILNGQGRLIGLAEMFLDDQGAGTALPRLVEDQPSFGGQSPRRPFLRPLRVFNFGFETEPPDGKE